MTLNDFEMLGILGGHACLFRYEVTRGAGRGGFGKVLRVRKKDSGAEYALKVLEKRRLVKSQQVRHVLQEKAIMADIRHPFIVQLWYAFQTPTKMYMVLDLAEGGDLFCFLQRQPRWGCWDSARGTTDSGAVIVCRRAWRG